MSEFLVRRDPLVVVAAVAAAAEIGWTAANLAGPVGPAWLGSAPLFVAGSLAVVAAFRAWRSPGAAAVARRFWRLMTVSFALTLLATLSELPQYLDGPVTVPGPLALTGLGVSTVLTLVALYRLPLGVHSTGERFRLLLDAATVTIATVVFAWYLSFGRGQSALSAQMVVASVVFCATHAVMVFGLVRVLLSESRDVPPAAVRVFAAGLAASTLSILATPLLAGHEPVGAEPAGRPVAYGLFVVAAVLQRRAVAGPPDTNRARRRPFSVAPYIAVASVDALLLATIAGDGMRVVVAAAAVTLTGLVIVRQLVAFRDNARLLGELARQERRFRSLVQNAADAIMILDEQGRAAYASPGIETLTGLPATHWLGRQAFTVHPDDLADVVGKFATVGAAPGRTVHYESRIANGAGEWQWVRVTLTNRLDDPAVGGIVANVSDVDEARAFQDQLAHQATHDPLTDLANRSLLLDRLSRSAGPVSLALVDLDDFKSVNDTMGHPAGDALLVTVATRLRDCVRATDLVARLGGDEFAILFHGDAAVAERALAALSRPMLIEGRELVVRASVGVATAAPGDDADTVMRAADLALYRAKAAGKGCVAHYEPGMTPAPGAHGLYRALTRGQLVLHYRPVVGVPDSGIVGMRALLRWNHPSEGPVPAVPLAEETGLIVPIGRWMLLEACREAAGWPGATPPRVGVTVSPRQLRDADLVADVRDALVATGLPPHRLTVGIVGTDVLDTDPARAAVRELHRMGVRIALDDAGRSTLDLLTDLPVDELTLDRSVLADPGRRPLATAVTGVARALGIAVVTDGSTPATPELAVAALVADSGAT
ncbi:putative bifunctional diguanylate cyclase/phosphodiesterase [Virgisporangium ochraceum]|uniref:Diguanylate cyclase/phosphodiesterase with PAS/PAC sensor(S) n=1 Tax=Virgisporangium ochraceum TaxID=65505 RepID=A0A8J3ZLQ9_9ACTN|nr:EAL domain-containing protein [Virgisporangium ochraceum]GIJ65088.1 hypothetical protein Voc01_000050 [Virgisporangium ochraceum]